MIDLFQLLIKDHKKVKALLNEMLDTTPRATQKRAALVAELKSELLLHEQKEEKQLYPLLKTKSQTEDMTLEAYQEHRLADDLLKKLEKTDVQDETWEAKVKVLQESLLHHIDEEEEKKLFPKAEKILTKEEIAEITAGIKAIPHAQ